MAAAIVMAAGLGTRMKSSLVKVLHPVLGQPMIVWVVDAARKAGIRDFTVVVGHQREKVSETLVQSFPKLSFRFAHQREQLGTAHAVLCAKRQLKNHPDDVLILCGDTPLLTPETLRKFMRFHKRKKPALSMVAGVFPDPTGYGRLVRDELGGVRQIIEETEADEATRGIKEVNLGVYLVSAKLLFRYLSKIEADNKKGEYFLTDLVRLLAADGKRVETYAAEDIAEFMGINDRWQLARAHNVLRERIMKRLAKDGVTIVDPERTHIEPQVRVSSDVVIWPEVALLGRTTVKSGCEIAQGAVVANSTLEEGVRVHPYSVIDDSRIESGAEVGPFARVRPKTVVGAGAVVGNFVEVKNTRLGAKSQAKHLTYLGDSVIGERVNIGAGTITCNYDGFNKYKTIIDDEAFIGSDSQFIAPVRIGKGAYIGSGSTITKDVPEEALAVTRADQKILKGWVKRKRRLAEKKRKG